MLAVHQLKPIVALLVLATFSTGASEATRTKIEFNRDIRPIITENCYACHGPDKNQRKAKLRLDVREIALERGAIVPGKPAESKLVEHIFASDPDELMPPAKSRKVLTEAQKELLRQWIADGAEYEPHWAYIPLKRPAVPQPANAAWARNPIDAFILATLEGKSIRPSKEAPKAELLRRLSLDLIGLPPTPAELDDFLKDPSPAAYERQVDRLLSSPHYGERMAVPWLDIVRYADTVGYHGDQNQNIFPYRDYVIDSFNRDKPFDQFTVEQLAGDLLPAPTVEQQIASGFNRLNMVTREGGAQPKEYLSKYAADRVRTVSMAWLGSTMGCAECHDHKYDPFTSKDFYQMEAFFADIKQWGVYADYDYTPNVDLKGVGNDHPFPPEIEAENPYLHRRITYLRQLQDRAYLQAASQLRDDPRKRVEFEQWRKASHQFLQANPDGWQSPLPQVSLGMKDTNAVPATNFVVLADGTVNLSEMPREKTRLIVPIPQAGVGAIRLEIIPQPEVRDPTGGATRFKPDSLSLKAAMIDPNGAEQPLKFSFADADHKTEHYAGGQLVLGVKDRWQLSPYHERQTAVWLLDAPIPPGKATSLILELGGFAVASVRAAFTPFPALEPLKSGNGHSLAKALASKGGLGQADRDLLQRTFLMATAAEPERVAQIRQLQAQVRECRGGRAFTMITLAREPLLTRVLRRGNWQDEGGDIVLPLVPHFLPQIPNPEKRRLTRLDLARWLVSPQNPLTSRAVMNRLWKQFFGTGISAVVDDLGAQGEWPVHPELLDWLACEFRQPSVSSSGEAAFPWDLKHMVRLIVLSSTYRQDSNERPELKEIDPNNRLLAAQSPRRLEAEFVRDNALAIAGLLNPDIGGPSVFPYQPPGYYTYLQWPDREYYSNTDDRQYRRGLYTHWQRAFLHPMLANFDAPSREECTANRIVSDTPQQALTLLNDPTFVEAARVFAAHLLSDAPQSDEEKLDAAFERALARSPRTNERSSLIEFLNAQREHYSQDQEGAAKVVKVGNSPAAKNLKQVELAAWTQVCRVILNLHETITRY
ncbi:MAG TPA: PSD1 and planctomycete cytochrome C domain-containing protein [Verrucomicrobiae bacterium]|nr:PSD1 and planctomycete cytochrome C domain-containing protein [Verrucomicrobiae bacterium]